MFFNHPEKMNCPVKVRHKTNFYGGFFMVKLTVEQKIQAVERYVNGHEYESMRQIVNDTGVTRRVNSDWVRLYRENGQEAFSKSYTIFCRV